MSVTVPLVVPFTMIDAPITGSLLESVTMPFTVIRFCCTSIEDASWVAARQKSCMLHPHDAAMINNAAILVFLIVIMKLVLLNIAFLFKKNDSN